MRIRESSHKSLRQKEVKQARGTYKYIVERSDPSGFGFPPADGSPFAFFAALAIRTASTMATRADIHSRRWSHGQPGELSEKRQTGIDLPPTARGGEMGETTNPQPAPQYPDQASPSQPKPASLRPAALPRHHHGTHTPRPATPPRVRRPSRGDQPPGEPHAQPCTYRDDRAACRHRAAHLPTGGRLSRQVEAPRACLAVMRRRRTYANRWPTSRGAHSRAA